MTDEPLWGGFLRRRRKKKKRMPESVRTHRERNALNAPEDAFNDRYKLSIFPRRKTQSPFMGTEATCDNSRGLC